jgi:hypothetical protein
MSKNKSGPRILFLDLETKPLISYTWGIWDQNIGLNQIKEDWSILSFAAKWRGDKKVIYSDNRKSKDLMNDKKLMQELWELLDEADIIVTQNGKSFDEKKFNARFAFHGIRKPSSYKHYDTKRLCKKYFSLTSYSLAYLCEYFKLKHKKLTHAKFPGMELWKECIKGNNKAWEEMREYNIHDILTLEDLFNIIEPWEPSINYNIYTDDLIYRCSCGSEKFDHTGYHYTKFKKVKKYNCTSCGKETLGNENLLSKVKRESLKK